MKQEEHFPAPAGAAALSSRGRNRGRRPAVRLPAPRPGRRPHPDGRRPEGRGAGRPEGGADVAREFGIVVGPGGVGAGIARSTQRERAHEDRSETTSGRRTSPLRRCRVIPRALVVVHTVCQSQVVLSHPPPPAVAVRDVPGPPAIARNNLGLDRALQSKRGAGPEIKERMDSWKSATRFESTVIPVLCH